MMSSTLKQEELSLGNVRLENPECGKGPSKTALEMNSAMELMCVRLDARSSTETFTDSFRVPSRRIHL